MEALLSNVLDAVGAGDDGSDVPMPEMSDTVHLPPPSTAMRETRAKLAEIEKKELTSLRKQLKEAQKEVSAEQEVIDAATYNVEEELANGETRESLSARKVAAQVASEIIEVRIDRVENLKAQIEVKRREMLRRATRLTDWLSKTEIATRAYQISLITGSERLNTEKFRRAYVLLQQLETYATEMLGEDLAQRVVKSITHNPVPSTLHECLLEQMHTRDRKEIQQGDK